MDRVRFGRVLGKGARLAARTALEAVDAATASAPDQPKQAVRQPAIVDAETRTVVPRHDLRMPAVQVPTNFVPAARTAGAGVLQPIKQASQALWHELTGSFFALFGLSFAVGAWHTRAGLWSHVPGDRNRPAVFCALAVVFLYFSVSSFLRARRRTTT